VLDIDENDGGKGPMTKSSDDYLYFDEESHPVVPTGLDLLLYEPGKPANERTLPRGRFVAGAAAGGLALLGAGSLARASLAAKPLQGLARQGILAWETDAEPAQMNPIGPANDPPVRFPTLWNSSSLFRFTNRVQGAEFDLARAFKVARDGSYWDVFLRPGVTWHDGTPFTAADVAATYNTTATPSYGSAWVGFMSLFASAEVIDPLTVRMHMKQTATWWIYTMAALPIVKAADAPNKDALATKPMGTGPFVLQQWNQGDRMIFTPNTSYYGNSSNKFKRGLPKLKGVQYITVPDANVRMIDLRNGMSALTAAVPPQALKGLQNNHGIKVYGAKNTPNRLVYFIPQAPDYAPAPAPAGSKPRPEWADVNNRKALAYALDRQAIAEVAFAGRAEPATSALAPGSLFYDPNTTGYGPRADVAKAKAFLNAASIPITRTLDFIVRGTAAGPTLDAATIMQANWKAIGINVNIMPVDGATQTALGRIQNFDISMLSSVTGPSAGRSPNSWLVKLTPNTASYGLRGYPDSVIKPLVDTITGALDRTKVQAAMEQLQQIEIDSCCQVGVVYPDYYEAQGVPLSNYGILNLGYLPYRVDEAQIV
jgi:peptide/nickel transport system substrate-binding protein